MTKEHRETIIIRFVSVCFFVVALAIFKPFGLDSWQWEGYAHLLAIGALGFALCMVTDAILKFGLKMPAAYDRGVSYIISRNLRFQLINTPLISLMACLYRHFVLSDLVESNRLSLSNFIETLLIFAFCSFAIGLYWRFKFRSRYLAAELEETRQLNEQLQRLQNDEPAPHGEIEETAAATPTALDQPQPQSPAPAMATVTLKGTTSEAITLHIANLLYIEAVGNYAKVYHLDGGKVRSDMLRATSKQLEDDLSAFPMIVRCHRAFIVNLRQVEQIVSKAGTMQLLIKHSHDYLPVSRSNATQVKEAINNA